MARTTRETWLSSGLQILGKEGVEGLTIDELCRRLDMTKGSFYHHFKNRAGYIEALLMYWEQRFTEAFIEMSASGSTPIEKMQRLAELTLNVDDSPEIAIRSWAMHDPIVRAFQERVDTKRIGYLAELMLELTNDSEKSEHIALLIYTNFIGSLYVIPPPSPSQILAMNGLIESITIGDSS